MSLPTLSRCEHVPDKALIVVASIAIWNREKLVVGISLGVWGCNAAFLVQGKPLLFNRTGVACLTRFGARRCTSEFFLYFGFYGLIRW